jgi:AcrR family transcriptional regulator
VTGTAPEGLRERKKRQTRQRISDTATALFLERGFDEVTVVEIARACEVSEKTVYNYFPTKESLLLDREEGWTGAIRRALGPGGPPGSPVAAVVRTVGDQLDLMLDPRPDGEPPLLDASAVRGVSDLIRGTPSLRAADEEMTARIVDVAAAAIARRWGLAPDDPEPQIAAVAVVGLWRVQFRALRRHSAGALPPAVIRDRVLADVRRAARVIEDGVGSIADPPPP